MLRPETRMAVAGIILIVIALIVILSFFDLAGITGEALLIGIKRVFGWLAYGVPVLLIYIGFALLRPHDDFLDRTRIIGIVLAVIGLLGVAHISGIALDDSLQAASEGKGGGYLGFLFSYPLSLAFSQVVAALIFVSSLLVGVFLTFNISPIDVWSWIKNFLPQGGSEHEDDGDEETVEDTESSENDSSVRTEESAESQRRLAQQQQKEQAQQDEIRRQVKAANRKYRPPSLDLLHLSSGKPNSGDTEAKKEKLRRTLENFGISVTMGEINVGPTVTQFTLRPEEGVKLARITALQNDISLALAAHPIRIEAPIPNKDMVGIEIPNEDVSLVRLRDLLATKEFKKAESPLTLTLGKDVSGTARTTTLEGMPHLLIAGSTGSGKSIFINTLLLSLIYRNSPDLVRLILVDPKRVELSLYDGIPHLLAPVIIDSEKSINALKWAVREMDRRYHMLSDSGSRNLLSYNMNNPDETMPFIVIVIDELADIMAKHAREVEGTIVRLSQMARAVGIHLVLATQRPSVNVITGLIKANIPARIAFMVASQVDSRTILDSAGADKLLGSGDMLYLAGDQAKPVRLQGGFVSEEEVRDVVEAVRSNEDELDYDESITSPNRGGGDVIGEAGEDDLFEDAKQVVLQSGKASASLLQRRLRVGYARAARLLDMLEEQQIIGPAEGNKPREILVADDQVDQFQEDATPPEVEGKKPSDDERRW